MEGKWLERLEFDKVRKAILPYTLTHIGQKLVNNLEPISDFTKVKLRLDELEEALQIERLKGGLPVEKINDVEPHLKRLKINASLNGIEIAEIGQVLRSTSYMVNFFNKLETTDEYPKLAMQINLLQPMPEISQRIRQCLSQSGEVLETATSTLSRIKKQIQSQEVRIKSTLEQTLRSSQKYLSDVLITMRNDRYVLPVKQEYRQIFGGVVHDQSSSGQTLFIEPKNVVELNNKLHQLRLEERQEITRILNELSELLMPYVDEIQINTEVLGYLDFIQSKVAYAKAIKAIIPKVEDKQAFNFKQARHPLIDIKKAVANDLYLGTDFKTLVITGPNTGGKTITLKTIGLLQMMGQAGLAIPVAYESELGIFDQIMADIGDEQSIEQNLSTFSAHMVTVKQMLDQATNKSLLLFDELGAGTDPKEGASLAMAILDTLQSRGAYVVATTHYPELKWYGDDRLETMNASMEFDQQTLKPTYRLLIGIPGRSNAFEIATKLGLDKQTIVLAKSFMDNQNQSLNHMITDLEERRQKLEIEYDNLAKEIDDSSKLHKELSEAYQNFTKQKEKMLQDAKKESNKIIRKASEEAKKIIQDLKDKQAEIEKVQVKEHELIDMKTKLTSLEQEESSNLRKNKVLRKEKAKKELKVGQDVNVLPYGQRGTIIGQKKGEWEVQLGVIKMLFSTEDLEGIATVEEPKQTTQVTRSSSKGVLPELDLRGKRYEEAMIEVDRYLDQALLAGYAMVTLIHGKGTGALRKGIWNHLKTLRQVDHYEYASANAGGNGATVVYFK